MIEVSVVSCREEFGLDWRTPLICSLAQHLARLDEFQDYGAQGQDVSIEVLLTDRSCHGQYLGHDIHSLGCFAIAGSEPDTFLDRYLVLINMERDVFDFLVRHANTKGEVSSLDEVLKDWLLTLPHELAHAAEFIAATKGRTPREVVCDAGGNATVLERTLLDGHTIEELERMGLMHAYNEAVELRIDFLAARWMQMVVDKSSFKLEIDDAVKLHFPRF
ncbi:MAG: hypothetical protein KGI54_02500 [Pseudomonadota bacterium]|nr:hypothetical protein [Pseudomonadota bacterium]